jgi:hypothetical protein
MPETKLSRATVGFGLSLAITSLLSTLLVLVKETNKDTVLAWLTSLSGHHWISHGILNLIVFVLLGWLLTRWAGSDRMSAGTLIWSIFGAVVVSGVITAGFFLT